MLHMLLPIVSPIEPTTWMELKNQKANDWATWNLDGERLPAKYGIEANYYLMNYTDQLVLTGEYQ